MSNETNKSLTISISGLWFIGWLFTIGFADLSVGRTLLALLLWPYYVGTAAHL
jgi:hypothetical protein